MTRPPRLLRGKRCNRCGGWVYVRTGLCPKCD